MPDRTQLQVGDRLRLLCVPANDRAQREHGLASDREKAKAGCPPDEMVGYTADTIDRIIDIDPVVTIHEIDEYGSPWYEVELSQPDGMIHYHSLSIMEDDSWALET